ncbi:MAG: hypothetical protein WAN86_13070 [Hyphomicrobiaceae bacterium]
MLTHAAPQLTPAQLIDAGRRAEAQGRADLAVQFYRYLTEYFAEAVEAAEAHNALGRIGAAQSLPRIATPQPQPAPMRGAQRIRSGRRRPEQRRDPYRTGRILTALFCAIGWLLAVAGTGALPAFLLLRAEVEGLSPAEMLPLAGGAAGGVILGCGVVLVAHVARALFDQANAVHHLLALERARHEGD